MDAKSCAVALIGWLLLVSMALLPPWRRAAPDPLCAHRQRIELLEREPARGELPLLVCPDAALERAGCTGPPPGPGGALVEGEGCEGAGYGARQMRGAAKLLVGLPIELNEANVADLEALPGIGAGTARKIWENRERLGPFHSVDELARVRGIGAARLRGLRELLVVGGGDPSPGW